MQDLKYMRNKAHIEVAELLLVKSKDHLTNYGQASGNLGGNKLNLDVKTWMLKHIIFCLMFKKCAEFVIQQPILIFAVFTLGRTNIIGDWGRSSNRTNTAVPDWNTMSKMSNWSLLSHKVIWGLPLFAENLVTHPSTESGFWAALYIFWYILLKRNAVREVFF